MLSGVPDRRVPRRRRDHQGDAARAVRHAQSAVGPGQRLREDGSGRVGAAAPGGQRRRGARAGHPMAPRPAAVDHGARRGAGQRAVAGRRQRRLCQAEAAARRPARRLPHRAAGRGRGVGQEPGLDQRQDAGHAAGHPAAADGAAAALRQDPAGAGDGPARPDRRGGGAADVPGRRSASSPSSASSRSPASSCATA